MIPSRIEARTSPSSAASGAPDEAAAAGRRPHLGRIGDLRLQPPAHDRGCPMMGKAGARPTNRHSSHHALALARISGVDGDGKPWQIR